VKALQTSVALSLQRYNDGIANYFEVLEAEQQLFPAELDLARTQRDELVAIVTLYRVLGGGWRLELARWSAVPEPGEDGTPRQPGPKGRLPTRALRGGPRGGGRCRGRRCGLRRRCTCA